MELPCDPAIALLHVEPIKLKTHKSLVLSSISHKVETTQMFFNRQMDKQNVLCPQRGILLRYEEEWITDTCYTMNLENIRLCEKSQKQNATSYMSPFI